MQEPGFDPDRETRDIIEDVQRRVAQETGVVPFMPFVTNPLGHLVELVEEDVRYIPEPTDEEPQ